MFKWIFSVCSLVFLFSLTPASFAEIYTWVDENGKKHFGDKIPDKYKKQAENVKIRTNTIELDKYQKKQQKALGSSRAYSSTSYNSTADTSGAGSGSDSCEQRKAAYRESEQCFISCRIKNKSWPNPTYNLSNCGHCRDVSKPAC